MLVRSQILLEEKQKLELLEMAAARSVSISELVRQSVPLLIEKEKSSKRTTGSRADALLAWSSGAVVGPGDSEYDKYAYGE